MSPTVMILRTMDYYCTARSTFRDAAEKLKKYGWQLAVHAIGDSANRYALDLFEEVLGDSSQYYRWRIEHAQIVDPKDKTRFGELGVIASVQPTHATSDMYWAEERLGEQRNVGGICVGRFT